MRDWVFRFTWIVLLSVLLIVAPLQSEGNLLPTETPVIAFTTTPTPILTATPTPQPVPPFFQGTWQWITTAGPFYGWSWLVLILIGLAVFVDLPF